MKTTAPTLEQHAQNGRLAYDTHLALGRLLAFASEAYGKTLPEVRAAKAAQDRLQTYRCRLDSRVMGEQNPPRDSHIEAACWRCYYPGSPQGGALGHANELGPSTYAKGRLPLANAAWVLP
ncbi:hypothetical protein SAMN05444747_101213 [Variovorax sp. OV329]|nr:hypothetical protein SAMN05444747_101213 [Variovorax sp. OV329]